MRKTPLLAAACVLFLVASARSQDGTQARLQRQQIADAIRQAAEKAVAEAGAPREWAEGLINQKVQKILQDPDLDPNKGSGVNQKQLDSAIEYIGKIPAFIKLRSRAELDPKNPALAQQLADFKLQAEPAREASGTGLKAILTPLDQLQHPAGGANGGQGGGAGGSGAAGRAGSGSATSDDGLFGSALVGLMTGASDFGAGQYQAALTDYGRVLQIDPKNAGALSGSASADFHLKNYDDAYKFAQAALQLNPSDQNALAVLHFSADRISGAGAAAASVPGANSSADSTASVAGSPGAGPASGGAALAAASVRTPAAAAALRQADAANAIGDAATARAAVERGLAAEPGDPALLARRSALEARAGDWSHSLADAQAALAKDPKNMALLRAEALAQLRTKDYAGAIATANEMLELDPNSADAYALRGQAYGLLGKNDLMQADLDAAARLDPAYKTFAERAKAGTLVAPADSDMLFLMPGETAAGAGIAASFAAGPSRRFGWVVAVAGAGGLLLAFGLLQTVFAPLKEKTAAALTQLARTGPTLGSFEAHPEVRGSSSLIRGQYELSREIGAGGMGRVYEGTDRSLGRRVAVKKMREELRADAGARARFVAEAKTVAALHHPNIVDIYAIADEGDDVYLVFEYIDGKTVHELVYERGRLDPASTSRVVRASAEALEFAHGRGVIHRDMKPSNVMVDASGLVKVMDFGIARAAKDALSASTRTNTIIGTPPYMAPEQEQGHVRRESDVYALAVCAYEMLTGELPFAGVGAGMTLNKTNMTFTTPSQRGAGLPAALDAVFSHAFQPDPARRTPTPRAFASELEAALSAAARA
jgi:tetratricopeptide (TPR) repeat protein